MAVPPSRIRATNKYIKSKTRRFTLQCHVIYDADIIKLLESQDNYNGYLKELLRREASRTTPND